ncbi:MAG: spheroidene monooxygenase [Deinococcus-Thermus bacterium]|nr:spheroidene monooxygenase [Deinococcota bacterium]
MHRFGPAAARLWAFAQMGLARRTLPQVPGIGAWKLCGSGADQGFVPIPNTAVWSILATWPDEATARARVAGHAPFTRWAARAEEAWTVFLAPTSVRGEWAGVQPFPVSAVAGPGPVAALTRATVRPRAALAFWRRTPDLDRAIRADPNVIFRIGIGEVPLMQQVTFSIWPDTDTMAAFARSPGSRHAEAIRAVREGGWFREELYARFRVLGSAGTWGGRDPLDRLEGTT